MVNFSDFIDKYRSKIANYFDGINIDKEDDYDKFIKKINSIDDDDYKYMLIIGYLDYFKITYDTFANDPFDKEISDEVFELYNNIKDYDDLLDNCKDDYEFIYDLIDSITLFYKMDNMDKRSVMSSCKNVNKYLIDFSKLHILDLMYYSFPYTIDDFYNKYLEFSNGLFMNLIFNDAEIQTHSIEKFSNIMGDLFTADSDNYIKLVDDLLSNYKFMTDNNNLAKKDNEIEKLLLMCGNDDSKDVDIYNNIYYNENIRFLLLKYYLNYRKNNDNEKGKKYIK